jgi:glyoxylase-like metal-dependent hydrolase (beta-lactamase superfamily II)
MRIHALNTGSMTVKQSYVEGKGHSRLSRLTSVLFDPKFHTPIPIYTWVIEHPEGTIVIDTGETAQVNDPSYFPAYQRPYWTSQYRFHITPEDEIGPQLRRRGIEPESVRWVIMTHAHFDHSDGLYHFPNATFLFSRKEYEDTQIYRSMRFAFPDKWPQWLIPQLIDYVPERIGPFEQSYTVTKAGDVRIVPTPGHTMGHQSVLLTTDTETIFFGGDTSFDLRSLEQDIIDAPAYNSDATLLTRQRIKDFALDVPVVYLTTHDPETEHRLNERTLLRPINRAEETEPVIANPISI